MDKAKWLVAALGMFAAGAANADEQSGFFLEPFVGYSHLRVDHDKMVDDQTNRLDQVLAGVSVGYKTPFGLVFNAGYSNAIHDDIFVFDFASGYELDQYYGTVGYAFDFGDGWQFTPKAGRARWRLQSDDRQLLDNFGEQQKFLDGYENFVEVSLMRNISPSISMGLTARDVDADFGHSRSGAFSVTFAF